MLMRASSMEGGPERSTPSSYKVQDAAKAGLKMFGKNWKRI
jgi:hypothetical protein